MARATAIAVLVSVFIIVGCPPSMEDGLSTMLTYHFFHANVFHLAVNCLAIWTMFPPERKGNLSQILFGLAVSFLVYPLHIRPIIGASNAIFAVAGLRTPPLSHAWWRSSNAVVYLGVMFAMLLIPQFSAVTHIVSFAVGVLSACVLRYFKELSAYADRYIR